MGYGDTEWSDLDDLDSDYQSAQAPAQKRDGDPGIAVPDGSYTADIIGSFMTRSKTSGNPMLKLKLRVVGGPCDGGIVWKNCMLTLSGMPYVKADLETLGLHLDSLSQLPDRCGELEGLRVKIAQKTKNDYTNIYVNSVVERVGTRANQPQSKLPAEPPQPRPAPRGFSEDDLPF